MREVPRWAEPIGRKAYLARIELTRAAWPVMRRLPGDSTRIGPPRHFADSVLEWARDHPDVDVRVIDEASTWVLPPPAQPSSEMPPWFGLIQDHELFPTWVARIPNGRVFGTDSTVIAHDDTVFGELHNWWPKAWPHHQILLGMRLGPPTRVRGSVAVLGAKFADSYFHWLVDIVPRIRLLRGLLEQVDYIVVPSTTAFQRECLAAADVPLDRLIEPHKGMHLIADELVVPSLAPRLSEWILPYVQSLFAPYRSTEDPRRRLYVTRNNMWRRRVSNERELLAALEPLGFESVVMDGLSVGEQARLFSEAEVVLAPHGGALANIAFAQTSVRLVEIFDANYVNAGVWELAARAGGVYQVLIIPSDASTSQWRNVTVPIPELLTMLAASGLEAK